MTGRAKSQFDVVVIGHLWLHHAARRRFPIDFLPSDRKIIVASPCSGHGFKFASVVGEILADLALNDETPLPIAAFSFAALGRRAAAMQGAA